MARRLLLALLPALLLALPAPSPAGPAGIGWDNGISARKGKAATVAELADMYDARHCDECHPEIAKEWEDSLHSRSIFGTGRTAATIASTVTSGLATWPWSGVKGPEDVKVEHLMGCAKCHLPQLADATDEVAREVAGDIFAYRQALADEDEGTAKALAAKLKSLNIGCLVCHNRNAVVHKYADGYPAVRTVYGAGDRDGHLCGTFPRYRKSGAMGNSVQCAPCHGQGPNFELPNPTQCATLYGSYLFSYIPAGGTEECQDCHMRKSGLGHRIQAYRSPVMAEMALDFDTFARADMVAGAGGNVPGLVAEATVVNRAGHSIPDG